MNYKPWPFKLILLLFSTFYLLTSLYSQNLPKPLPFAHSWKDKDNVILVQITGQKREFFEYNIRKETLKPVETPPVRVLAPTVTVKEGNIVYTDINGQSKVLTQSESVERNPTFSPDYKRVAFTRDNDLYSVDVESGEEIRYTFDGSELILNGWASWVYFEEIFGRAGQYRAFWWSQDGTKLAFYRFDDSLVPMFPIYDATGKHGSVTRTRYPKAGDVNPEVRLGFVDVNGGDIVWADFDPEVDQYFGTPFWSVSSNHIMVQWMDRDQSNFVLYSVNTKDGSKRVVYEEYQKTWVDWIGDIRFGREGFYFVRDFELWEHIYYQTYDGQQLERLTDGMNWGVRIIDLDEKSGTILFTARRESSLRNDVYRLEWGEKGKSVTRLSNGEFNYTSVLFSPDKRHFVATASNHSSPPKLVLLAGDRRGVIKQGETRVIKNSVSTDFDPSQLPLPAMMSITTPEGFKLPGTIIYPFEFDNTKKYPVIINIYGGPNSTSVMDTWRNPSKTNFLWAKEGVIQVTVDNRASGHAGKEGINYVHRNLGHFELIDYIQWSKYLKSLEYVNEQKIGITGFSYGGTMTVLALTDGADYFNYGVAGAGVYDWMLYDTHYTERYMDHPHHNPEGYKLSAANNKASKYRSEFGSRLFLTHGTADDNVHLQNTLQLIYALQKEGKQFELMLYPGAFHGYRGYQGNHHEDAVIDFWRRMLLGK